jgi:hypothetical protein
LHETNNDAGWQGAEAFAAAAQGTGAPESYGLKDKVILE